jgi:hypothetical protein
VKMANAPPRRKPSEQRAANRQSKRDEAPSR